MNLFFLVLLKISVDFLLQRCRLVEEQGFLKRYLKAVYLGTTPQFLAAHRFYEKNGFTSIGLKELPENFPLLQVDKKFYQYSV